MTSTLKESAHLQTKSSTSWPGVGEYGLVPITAVLPNPLNPRWDAANDVDDLVEAVRADGQREIVTVRLATPEEQRRHSQIRYVIISGERRYHSARAAKMRHVEVRVKAYDSLGLEMQDMFQLNENRRPLTDIENAVYIGRLAAEFGWKTQTEIARGIGRDNASGQIYVSNMLAILRCTDKVKERMHPHLEESERLGRGIAVLLSKLDPPIQDDLVERLPAELKTGVAQIAWIKHELTNSGIQLPTRRRDPKDTRRMVFALANMISHRVGTAMSCDDFKRMFENTTGPDAQRIVAMLQRATVHLGKLLEDVTKLANDHKGEADAASKTGHGKPEPASGTADPAQSRTRAKPERLFIERWSPELGRFVQDNVDLRRYAELWTAGLLRFQKEKMAKPTEYLDISEIVGL